MPKELDDPLLGRLEWDDALDWWAGVLDLEPGQRVEVFIDFHAEEDVLADVLSRARLGLARIRRLGPEYRRWTARQLLDRRWNCHEPMTVDDITELLKVASISFASDGAARVYWDDEDVLFGGHNVVTEIGPDGKCLGAGME